MPVKHAIPKVIPLKNTYITLNKGTSTTKAAYIKKGQNWIKHQMQKHIIETRPLVEHYLTLDKYANKTSYGPIISINKKLTDLRNSKNYLGT